MKKQKSKNSIEEASASEERAHADLAATADGHRPPLQSDDGHRPPLQSALPPAPDIAIRTADIPIEKLKASPTNPRKKFDPEELEGLEASMRAHGFTMSMLLVRPWPETYRIDMGNGTDEDGQFFVMKKRGEIEEALEMLPNRAKAEALLAEMQGCYEVVAGERRLRAARAVGLTKCPAIIQELSDCVVLEMQLVENLQREDLTPSEAALGFRQALDLRDDAGRPMHTAATLSLKTGKSVDTIWRHVRLCALLDVPGLKTFMEAYEAKVIGIRHVNVVLRVPVAERRLELAQKILYRNTRKDR